MRYEFGPFRLILFDKMHWATVDESRSVDNPRWVIGTVKAILGVEWGLQKSGGRSRALALTTGVPEAHICPAE